MLVKISLYKKLKFFMPMNDNSTPNLKSVKKIRKFYAKPSEETTDFLKSFARTYVPEKTRLQFN